MLLFGLLLVLVAGALTLLLLLPAKMLPHHPEPWHARAGGSGTHLQHTVRWLTRGARCTDPWTTGYLVRNDTWCTTSLNPCHAPDYARLLNEDTGTHPSWELEALRDKSLIMIGDSLDRNLAEHVCRMPHFQPLPPHPDIPNDPAHYLDRHYLCRHARLNFTVGSFFIFSMSRNVSEDMDLAHTYHYRAGDPITAWERVERNLTRLLQHAQLPTPTLITMHSGYWNIMWNQGKEDRENEDLTARAARYTEGWQAYMLPTMLRLFPPSALAFRNVPYAARHPVLSNARLVALLNTLLRQQSALWDIPIFDHNLLSTGMEHLYQGDNTHHGPLLQDLYLDSVLYRLGRMVVARPPPGLLIA